MNIPPGYLLVNDGAWKGIMAQPFLLPQSIGNLWSGVPYRAARDSQLPHSQRLFLLNPSSLSLLTGVIPESKCVYSFLFSLHRCYPTTSPSLLTPILASASHRTSTDIPTYPILQFQGLLKSSHHILPSILPYVYKNSVWAFN